MTSPRVALYPGSFDILTNGHLDIIQRGRKLFDRLVVAVAANSAKREPTFSLEERVQVLREVVVPWPNVHVVQLGGLTVEAARAEGARFILRGLRAVSDFEFELQLAIMNHQLAPDVESIFLAPAPEWIFLSSSTVREVWRLGGDVSRFVPPPVLAALHRKKPPA